MLDIVLLADATEIEERLKEATAGDELLAEMAEGLVDFCRDNHITTKEE